MLSPRALSDRGLVATTAAAAAAESDDVGREDLLLVSRMSDMLGNSAKLSTLTRSRPADAEPARGAARGDDRCTMIPDTERRDSSRLNGGSACSESSHPAGVCTHANESRR